MKWEDNKLSCSEFALSRRLLHKVGALVNASVGALTNTSTDALSIFMQQSLCTKLAHQLSLCEKVFALT